MGSDCVAEKEREYGERYGTDAVNADLEYINSEKFAKKFDYITDNPAVDKSLLKCSRAAIIHRNNTLFEDMYIVDGISGEVLAKQLETSVELGITYNNEITEVIKQAKADGISIIALHSHPEGFPPSLDDLNSAYRHNYALGVVAGHNGQVYTYSNNVGEVKNPDVIQAYIDFAYKQGYDVDRAYKEAYQAIGFDYTIIRE